ncbi:MAG TPA: RDD family protein [Candidatus Acidoferrales bacterium]|nr:RDD family protein [Candidatus Acidoferrales bacterium]
MKNSRPGRSLTRAELTIATPEGVLFQLPLAGPAPRLYAMLLDSVIVLAGVNGVGYLVYWIFAKAPGFGVMTITLAEFALGFAYGALLEGFWNGQTLGKRLFHLRVMDESGLPLRIEQAWVRNLMRVVDALPLAYLVGGISVLSSPIMQRFGDRVAGTLVVRETPLTAPDEEGWNSQKYNSFTEYPAIAMHFRRAATPQLASLIQDALRRRSQLAPYARREIYRELAAYLQGEVSPFPAELVEILSDEQYLANAADVLFRDRQPARLHDKSDLQSQPTKAL